MSRRYDAANDEEYSQYSHRSRQHSHGGYDCEHDEMDPSLYLRDDYIDRPKRDPPVHRFSNAYPNASYAWLQQQPGYSYTPARYHDRPERSLRYDDEDEKFSRASSSRRGSSRALPASGSSRSGYDGYDGASTATYSRHGGSRRDSVAPSRSGYDDASSAYSRHGGSRKASGAASRSVYEDESVYSRHGGSRRPSVAPSRSGYDASMAMARRGSSRYEASEAGFDDSRTVVPDDSISVVMDRAQGAERRGYGRRR